MTLRKPESWDWESFAEYQIRQAQEEGAFDNLPGFGKPMPDLGDPNDAWWWVKRKLRQEGLQLLPPALEIQQLIHRTLKHIDTLDDEREVRRHLQLLDQKVRHLHYQVHWGPASTTMGFVDVEELLQQWRHRKGKNPPECPSH